MSDIFSSKFREYSEQMFQMLQEKRTKELQVSRLNSDIADLDINLHRLEAAVVALSEVSNKISTVDGSSQEPSNAAERT